MFCVLVQLLLVLRWLKVFWGNSSNNYLKNPDMAHKDEATWNKVFTPWLLRRRKQNMGLQFFFCFTVKQGLIVLERHSSQRSPNEMWEDKRVPTQSTTCLSDAASPSVWGRAWPFRLDHRSLLWVWEKNLGGHRHGLFSADLPSPPWPTTMWFGAMNRHIYTTNPVKMDYFFSPAVKARGG